MTPREFERSITPGIRKACAEWLALPPAERTGALLTAGVVGPEAVEREMDRLGICGVSGEDMIAFFLSLHELGRIKEGKQPTLSKIATIK